MAGKPVTTTFSQTDLARIDTVANRLHMTRQQFIREAVNEYLLKLNPFEMAGGKTIERERRNRGSGNTF